LDEKEEDIKKKITEAIADPSKFKDAPPTKTKFETKEELKAVVDIDVNDALLNK